MLNNGTETRGSSSGPGATPSPLRWPAPGLEPIHGAAWPPITLLAVGGAMLSLPLLGAIATPSPFWSTGPFGTSWWVPLVASVLGLSMVIRAMDRTARALLAAARAARQGYGWDLIAYTATDLTRDAGFLLQGLREYSTLGERERRWMLNARVVATFSYLAALLWVPLALSFGVLLAGRGVITARDGLLSMVLIPAAALLLIGIGCRLLDGLSTGRARKLWLREAGAGAAIDAEAAAWRTQFDERHATTSRRLGRPAMSGRQVMSAPLRGLGWAVVLAAVLLPLPLVTVAMASAVGPALAHITVPGFGATATRLARAAVLEPYSLDTDATITPARAGQALHALTFVGSDREPSQPVERAPDLRYAEPWSRGIAAPASLPPTDRFGTELFPRVGSLTAEELHYLEQLSSHPALAELKLLARAEAADIAGARWVAEHAKNVAMHELPLPRTRPLIEAANSHIAGAVLHTARGENDAAEERLREVISMGLLLTREGPTLLDVLVGNKIAETGGHALLGFFEATGQHRHAEAIRLARAGVDALDEASKAMRGARWEYEPHDLMASVENELLPRGMRWERLMNVQLVAGCLNAHNAVFGLGSEYRDWLGRARASLVRFPSEEALFAASTNGLGGELLTRRGDVVQRLVGVTLRGGGNGSCATVMGAMVSL
ncbi:hypothetical protein BH23GEM9_BH23GEM9_05270 [soil metagenome]